MNIKKALSVFLAIAILFGGVSVASAQTATTTASSTQQMIESLLRQITQLQNQIRQLQEQRQDAVDDILTVLNEGSTGDAVKALQALLAADPDIYPEGRITGFFGALTRRAVMNFQRANGLPQVGNVGPQTLQKLRERLRNNPLAFENSTSSEGKRPCAIVPPGHLMAPGWLRRQNGSAPIVPPCQTLPPGILGRISTSTPTSTPDRVAPILSRVRVSVATTSVAIIWNTNEAATSQVMYGTSTALGTSTTLDTALVTRHSTVLTGLMEDTKYYFTVESKDAAGNLATSSQLSFNTDED